MNYKTKLSLLLKITCSIFAVLASGIIAFSTTAMSRCHGICNGLEGLIVIFYSLPLWLFIATVCLSIKRNRCLEYFLFFLVGFIGIFWTNSFTNIRVLQEMYGFNYFPEIASIMVFLGIFFVPVFSIWKSIDKYLIWVFTMFLALSTVGTSTFFMLVGDSFNKGYCVQKNPKIINLINRIQDIRIPKSDITFTLKVVGKKCIASYNSFENQNRYSLNVDLKIVGYDTNNTLIFESKSFNSDVDNFIGRNKMSSEIYELFNSSRVSITDFFRDVVVENVSGESTIIYTYSDYYYKMVDGTIGQREAFPVDIGCKSKNIKRVDEYRPYPAESYSLYYSYRYKKTTNDKMFICQED